MKIIIEGNETEIAKIVKENSIRVRRGLLKVTHVTEEDSGSKYVDTEDEKGVDITDSKDVDTEDTAIRRQSKK